MEHQILKKQPNTKECFVCGIKNDWGIRAGFYETDKNEVISLFTPTTEHQSYPGRLHGGIASAILDETIGRAILIGKESAVWGVTLEMTVKYRKPIPLHEQIRVIGRIVKENNRFFEGTGEIILPSGEIAVTAHGRYLKIPIDKIADFHDDDFEWKVNHTDSDPTTVSIE
jgi:acyl-coenzyme A thioesterase PaaI-like protein